MQKYFIINTGSASKKFSLFQDLVEVCAIHLENEGTDFVATITSNQSSHTERLTTEDFEKGLEYAIKFLLSEKIIADVTEIKAVGVRVVAPGAYFQSDRMIDDEFIQNLEKEKEIIPLHIVPVLEILKYIKEIFPSVPIIGISDSAFHKELSDSAKMYAIPAEDSRKYGIQKYGYHGLSHQSVLTKIEKIYSSVPNRIILCHLGGGVSVTAVAQGKSFDTSMGFTPVSGAIMATRVGDIDAGAVLYLLKQSGMTFDQAEEYFNKQCGLLGASGKTADMRDLIDMKESGDLSAQKAIDMFQYRIKKEIGSAVAGLNGLDLLVFSGTIGERSHIIRSSICANLESLGIILDEEKNQKNFSTDGEISDEHSKVKVLVLKTAEMSQMAEQIKNFQF